MCYLIIELDGSIIFCFELVKAAAYWLSKGECVNSSKQDLHACERRNNAKEKNFFNSLLQYEVLNA